MTGSHSPQDGEVAAIDVLAFHRPSSTSGHRAESLGATHHRADPLSASRARLGAVDERRHASKDARQGAALGDAVDCDVVALRAGAEGRRASEAVWRRHGSEVARPCCGSEVARPRAWRDVR